MLLEENIKHCSLDMIKDRGGYGRLIWDQALFSLRFLNKILAGKAKSKSGRSSTGVKDFVSDPSLERPRRRECMEATKIDWVWSQVKSRFKSWCRDTKTSDRPTVSCSGKNMQNLKQRIKFRRGLTASRGVKNAHINLQILDGT